jgi:hypothetical protein
MPFNVIRREIVSKDLANYWTREGFCFQYNDVVTFPSATNKYYLFDPSAVPDDYTLYVFPLSWANCEDGPVYVNFYAGHNYTGGVAVNLINRNSNSLITPYSKIYENPTGTSKGILTSENKIAVGGGVPAFPGGGSSVTAPAPYIQSNQFTVLIEIVNASGGDVDAEGFIEICETPAGFNR